MGPIDLMALEQESWLVGEGIMGITTGCGGTPGNHGWLAGGMLRATLWAL